MGIIKSNVKMFLDAKSRGVKFDNLATLGRMRWYADGSTKRYADEFFAKELEAKHITVIDNSSYQGAETVLDLNNNIPQELEKKFDVVIDSGTLEHVFNFPVAIANCMKMLKVGGTIFISTPANNYMGHGLYQFSPELFFRIFQKGNGFELVKMYLMKHPYLGAELSSRQKLYEVVDPSSVGQRVCLLSDTPVLLMLEAKRVDDVPIFTTPPQQSDYIQIWLESEEGTRRTPPLRSVKNIAKSALDKLPITIRGFIWGQYEKFKYSLWNKKFFKKIKNV